MIQTVLLRDIADIQTGPFGSQLHQEDYVDDGTPIITVEHLGNDRITTQNLPRVSEDDKQRLSKYWMQEGDTIFSRVGSVDRASYVHKTEDRWLFSGRCLRVRPDQTKVNPRYLSFVLRSPKFTNYIKSIAVGATMPSINTKLLATAPVTLLPHAEQDKVANILDAIEEKIELNRQMNETLEQMGQTLFRHYFINNPEVEKWEKKSLGDFVELVNGASYKSTELQPSSHALVTLKSVGRGGGFSRRGYKEYTGKMKDSQIVHDGDLVVAHTDLTQKAEVAGYPALVDGAQQYDQVAISMDLVKVVPRSQELSSSVVYFLLKTREFQDHKMGYISGSTVLHLSKKCIPSYEIAMPSDEAALQVISSEFDDLMEKIKDNNQQTQTLTTLRDTLLPRLISGKVKV